MDYTVILICLVPFVVIIERSARLILFTALLGISHLEGLCGDSNHGLLSIWAVPAAILWGATVGQYIRVSICAMLGMLLRKYDFAPAITKAR